MAHRTAEQLKVEYPDADWRERFTQICDLMEVLGDCTISDKYAISDALNDAVALTPAGVTVRDRLARKEGVPVKEAKLMCALSIGHADLFIDVAKTDPTKLAEAVHREIADGRIIFPFIFGRDLYDQYAEIFDDEKDSLTNEETLNLLESLPRGVFQYGRYTVGPYGLQASSTARTLPASRRVPADHCSRALCRMLHPVLLATSHTAPVNRDREKLDNMLEARS